MNHYELAEHLSISPNELKKWLKKQGYGNGNHISKKAQLQARHHFQPQEHHPQAQMLQDQRMGLGPIRSKSAVSTSSSQQIRVTERPKRNWGPPPTSSKPSSSPKEKEQFIKNLRHNSSPSTSHSPTGKEQSIKTLRRESSTLISPSPKGKEQPIKASTHAFSPSVSSSSVSSSPKEKEQSIKTATHESSPSTPPKSSENYYKKKYQDLLDTFQDLKLKYQHLQEQSKLSNQEDLSDHSNLDDPPASEPPIPSESLLIWDELALYGLQEQEAIHTLLELLEHPIQGPNLLYSLKHDHPKTLLNHFSLYCGSQVCAEVARPYAQYGLIETSAHLCSICQGDSTRRWYRRLLSEAHQRHETRLALIGGRSDDYQSLLQLNRECPGIQWTLVNGRHQLSLADVKTKIQSCSLVMIWAGTHLPHALSGNVRQAADMLNIPVSTLPPGIHNVEAVCKIILQSWLGLEHSVFEENF